ncbi:MAG: hypothetical protein HPY71_10555 [Firmicutes bacterium]|nr:hypothetical protein [Bacillota bacterium]
MIISVTLNPCLDKTVFVDRVEPGKRVHVKRVKYVAGGKGLNIARILNSLGYPNIAFTIAGGWSGSFLEDLMREDKITGEVVRIRGLTRTVATVLEEDPWIATEYNEDGPEITRDEAAEIESRLCDLIKARRPEFVILSGSVPCRGLVGIYARVISYAKSLGVKTILDTRDEALADGIKAAPFMVKPNLKEAEALFAGLNANHRSSGAHGRNTGSGEEGEGRRPGPGGGDPGPAEELGAREGALRAVRALLDMSIQVVVLSLGRDGALVGARPGSGSEPGPDIDVGIAGVAATPPGIAGRAGSRQIEEGIWEAVPPQVEEVNPVASGDAFVGAFAYAMVSGMPLPECIRWGTAAGAANAAMWEPAYCSREQIEALLDGVIVRKVK